MSSTELLGFVAGSLVATSLLPQFIKSWKTKSTGDLSVSWNLINLAGQSLWIAYGIAISSPSLVIMSGITLLMACSILYLKIKYR